MITWNAVEDKIGYAIHDKLIAWKHITNIGKEKLKCNGKIVWMNGVLPESNYTSKYEIKIPVEFNEHFDEIVEDIFTKYDNGEIEKGMLLGRPRWNEMGKNAKTDAFDIKKLVDENVLRLYPNHVSTWFANKLYGRFNQNSARIHGFNDGKLKEMLPYMDEDMRETVEDIISQKFTSTENLAHYIKCVNENLGLILINVWGNYTNDLIGKIKSGIYYVSEEEFNKVKREYRFRKDAILEHYKTLMPNEKIRGVQPIKHINVMMIEKTEAKKRIEAFKKAIGKNRKTQVNNTEEVNVEPKTKQNSTTLSFLDKIKMKIDKANDEN